MNDKYIENLILILYSNGSINSFFIGVIVITLAGANLRSNKYISLLLITISISFFYVLFLSPEITRTIPYIFNGMHKSAFIFGPALYFYFMSITRRRFRFNYKKLIHLLPFAAYTLLMIPVYFSSDSEKIELFNKYRTYFRSVFFIIFLHFASYMAYTYYFIRSNGVIILNKFKGVESVAVNWFQYLSLLSLGLGCLCFILHLLHIFFNFSSLILNTSVDFMLAVLLQGLGYKGIRRIEILKYIPDTYGIKKYTKSGMNKLQAENYMDAVIQYIKRDRNFLNNEINLKLLSTELSISEHHLSQIFTQFLKMSFNDYVNSLRVEEAKKLIKTLPEDYPIMRIGFDVGFNSKSAFNLNFKKITKITPTEYRNSKYND